MYLKGGGRRALWWYLLLPGDIREYKKGGREPPDQLLAPALIKSGGYNALLKEAH